MAPMIFECIMFLHCNIPLWNERTVQIAFSKVIKEAREEHIERKMQHADHEEEDGIVVRPLVLLDGVEHDMDEEQD